MPGRNDPCPCGSGKKYKHCHQREDEAAPRAVRLVHGPAGAGGRSSTSALALPLGAVVPTDLWEVDLMPFAAELADDPTVRMTVLMVGAGEHVLSAEVLSHAPGEASAVAGLMADALAAACVAAGVRPATVLVRLDVLQDELAERLGEPEHAAHGTLVRVSPTLARLDHALADLERRAGVPPAEPGALLLSHPQTWAAWGFAPDETARFFAACDAYYRAAPWEVLWADDAFMLRLRDGGAWEGAVLGSDGEQLGFSLCADPKDLDRMLEGPETEENAALGWRQIRGVVLSLTFESREFIMKPMRDEIKKARWPVASPDAYPLITAVNTPGGGISSRQLQALTTALLAMPGFVEQHAAAIRGEVDARFPLRYTDRSTGASIELPDVQ